MATKNQPAQSTAPATSMAGLIKRKVVAQPEHTAYIYISDRGDGGKSTAAIATGTFLRAMSEPTDIYCCDADHQQVMEYFGQRDASGELLPSENDDNKDNGSAKQDPTLGASYFNIRTDGQQLVSKLRSPSKYKVFDMPAASIDELPKYFDSPATFLKAFQSTGTKLVFVMPLVDTDKCIKSIEKIKRMFYDNNTMSVSLQFVFVVAYSLCENVKAVLREAHANEAITFLSGKGVARIVEVKTIFNKGFAEIIKPNEQRSVNNWLETFQSGNLALEHEIALEGFLQEWASIVESMK